MKTVVSVVGARPQFVKVAAVMRAFEDLNRSRPRVRKVLVHTGQHYDPKMSDVFFEELGIPAPHHQLAVGSGTHGAQTAAVIAGVEQVLLEEDPSLVIVYGDTNTTLGATLAAAKLAIPVAHVEAGLRSHVRTMPEEINRVAADHLSTLLFCPSASAVANLRREGITSGVFDVGDVMLDVMQWSLTRSESSPGAVAAARFGSGAYAVTTVHRAANTDDLGRLGAILDGLGRVAETIPVLFPVHPRTLRALAERPVHPEIHLMPPVSHGELLQLVKGARVVLTDSGGLQKEAFWLEVPCVTLRDETEWPETLVGGWNVLAGGEPAAIAAAALRTRPTEVPGEPYGSPGSAERIAELIAESLGATP